VYEWDEAKRRSNLKKHGYDFADADIVYENPAKFTIHTMRRGEPRVQDVAIVEFQGVILTLVYVVRGYNIRIISFRKASRKERRDYDNFRAQKHDGLGPRQA
jgi:uncharacterized DUF497 family protein